MITVVPRRALVALLYMVGIFALSSLPELGLRRLGLPLSVLNFGHVPLYAGLAGITLWALEGPGLVRVAAAAIICALVAVSDEWHQTFVPGRVADVQDLMADGAGIVLGITVVAGLPAGWRAVITAPEEGDEGVET